MIATAIAIARRLPWRFIGPAIGAALALWAAVSWHGRQIEAVRLDAMQQQANLDAADFQAAWEEAEQQQDKLIADTRAGANAINKEAINDLQTRNDAIGRDYAALRQLWRQAKGQTQAAAGGAGQGQAAAVSDTAGQSAGNSCATAGWVDFDTAATVAEAADRNAAGWKAVTDWWAAQCKAWPGPKPDECM